MKKKIKFEWDVPEEIFKEKLWKDEKEAVREIKRSTILDLVRRHKISWRRGAELLGITYRKFLDLMGEYRIPVFDYEKGWLDKELKNFPTVHEK